MSPAPPPIPPLPHRHHWTIPPSASPSLITSLSFLADDAHLLTASSTNRLSLLSLSSLRPTPWSAANARRLTDRLQLLADGVQGVCVPPSPSSPFVVVHSSR